MLDENFRNLNLNSAIDFETDSGEYKFWMPGDLQPPNQTPFNENWYRLDKILKERKTNFSTQLGTLNGTIADNKSISDNKFNEITNQFNTLDTKVSDFRDLTFGNEYSDDVIDLKLLNLKAGTLLAAVELINEDVKKRALKSEIPTDYVTMADVEAKGYLTSDMETDPTVPAWAKEAKKPSYDISEINDATNNTSLLAIIENLQSQIDNLKNNGGSSSAGNQIIFSLGSVWALAEENMTWEQWVTYSNYNTFGAFIEEDKVKMPQLPTSGGLDLMVFVEIEGELPTNVIRGGATYNLV